MIVLIAVLFLMIVSVRVICHVICFMLRCFVLFRIWVRIRIAILIMIRVVRVLVFVVRDVFILL